MRGIVISPEIDILGKNNMVIRNSDIAPHKLREYLLYWDKIDFPINNIIHFVGNTDITYLQERGVLKRSEIKIQQSGEIVDLFLKSQLEAFFNNSNDTNTVWSLAQPNFNLALPKEFAQQTRSINVELYNNLPVPTSDVSLEDILFFKERRLDELYEFRYQMDKLYEDILNSQDIENSMERNLTLIQRKLSAIDQLLNESMMKRAFRSMKVNISISDLLTKALLGAMLGNELKFPLELGGIVGAMSSFINISIDFVLKPTNLPSELKDYAYLYYSQNELT